MSVTPTLIDRDVFVETLTLATKFCSTRSLATQALQGVCLKLEKDSLGVFATNLNTYFHTKLTIKTDVQQQLVVDPRKVIEFLNLLQPGEVELEAQTNKLVCKQGRAKGAFEVVDAQDFPALPNILVDGREIQIEAVEQVIPFVAFAASKDETRPALTAIKFEQKDAKQALVSTDGFRLSLAQLDKQLISEEALVPADFLQEVLRSSKNDQTLKLALSQEEKTLKITAGKKEFYTRLISEQFPLYEKVIPSANVTKVTVSTQELARAVKLVSIFARDTSNIIVVGVEKDTLNVQPKQDQASEAGTSIEASVVGEQMKLAFNYKFLLDYLQHIQSKQVIMELLRPDAPVVFRQEGVENQLHIIMPVRIQS